MAGIGAKVTYRFNDEMENVINRIFDTGIGLIGEKLVELAKDDVAVDTGRLKKSIQRYLVKPLEWNFSSGGPKVPYAAMQELGHLKGYKYKFTPFMRPAVIKITGNKSIMDSAFGDKLKGTAGFGTALSASRAMSSITP